MVVPPVRGGDGGTTGMFPHLVHRRAHPEVEASRGAQGLQACVGGQHARRGLEQHGAVGGDPADAHRRLGGREPLPRGARGGQRGCDGVERGLVAERHLARDVQEPVPAGALQQQPEVPGPPRHLDVERVGIAQPEDAGIALGARPLVADAAGGLEDDRVPAAARQGPRRAQPQKPGADDDAAAVGGHDDDHRNAMGAGPVPGSGGRRRYARRQ